MRRFLGAIVIAATTLAALLSAIGWIRSYVRRDAIVWTDSEFQPAGRRWPASPRNKDWEIRNSTWAVSSLVGRVKVESGGNTVVGDKVMIFNLTEQNTFLDYEHGLRLDVDPVTKEYREQVRRWRAAPPPPSGFRFAGFATEGYRDETVKTAGSTERKMTTTRTGNSVEVPYWFLLLVTLPAPVLRLARWLRRRHRPKQGRCAACGYDLRATPGRCPECGATPPPHNPAMQRTGAAGTVSVV